MALTQTDLKNLATMLGDLHHRVSLQANALHSVEEKGDVMNYAADIGKMRARVMETVHSEVQSFVQPRHEGAVTLDLEYLGKIYAESNGITAGPVRDAERIRVRFSRSQIQMMLEVAK